MYPVAFVVLVAYGLFCTLALVLWACRLQGLFLSLRLSFALVPPAVYLVLCFRETVVSLLTRRLLRGEEETRSTCVATPVPGECHAKGSCASEGQDASWGAATLGGADP